MKKLFIIILCFISIQSFGQVLNDFNGNIIIRGTCKLPNLTRKLLDSTNYKILVKDAVGNIYYMDWPTFGSGGSADSSVFATQWDLTQINNFSDQNDGDLDSLLMFPDVHTIKTKSIRTVDANGANTAVTKTITDSTIKYTVKIASGTYLPTGSSSTNITSNTISQGTYSRVGDVVTATFSYTVGVTAANTNSQISFTLPISSDFVDGNEANGTFTSKDGATGYITTDTTNDKVILSFKSTTTSSVTGVVMYQYTIK